MRIVPFKALIPILEKLPDTETFFDQAKFSFGEFYRNGLIRTLPENSFYIYTITDGAYNATGLVACADVADYLSGKIKKHEHTIISSEEKQTELLRLHNAVLKPVLLLHPPADALTEIYDEVIKTHPGVITVTIKGVKHEIRAIKNPVHTRIIQAVFNEKIPAVYIADGHHRAASAGTLYLQNKKIPLLCVFFSFNDVRIKPFHRVVKDLNGLTPDIFLEKISENFEIKILSRKKMPRKKNEMILFFQKKYFQLNYNSEKNTSKENNSEKNFLTDAELFNEIVLKKILDIADVRSSDKIEYLEDADARKKTNRKHEDTDVIFYLYGIQVRDFRNIVDTVGVMPPKSTFFEPRLLNGFVCCLLPE